MARLLASTMTGMGFKRARSGGRKKNGWADRFYAVPLGLRRFLAFGAAVLIALAALIIVRAADADFDHARRAVETQTRTYTTITDIRFVPRSGDHYYVRMNGEEFELDYAHFLSDVSIGTQVSYVVDPKDDQHLIAVGEPEDWEDDVWRETGASIVISVMVLLFAGFAAERMLPEDADALMFRAIDAQDRRRAKRRQERPRRRKPEGHGTGKHIW